MVGVNDVFGHQDAKTFMGMPPCDDLTMIVADAVLIGADCATPYPNAGAYCAGGPAAIRRAIAPYASGLGHMNFDLDGATIPAGKIALDAGDLPQDPGDPEGNRARITQAIGQIIDAGAVPFLLGGDELASDPDDRGLWRACASRDHRSGRCPYRLAAGSRRRAAWGCLRRCAARAKWRMWSASSRWASAG